MRPCCSWCRSCFYLLQSKRFTEEEKRARKEYLKNGSSPDEMIFPTLLSWISKQRERRRRIYRVVYISSAKNEKMANDALHECVREK